MKYHDLVLELVTKNCGINTRSNIASMIMFRDSLIGMHRNGLSHLELFKFRIRILCVPNEKADLHKTRSRIVTRILRGSDLSF